MLKVVQEKHFVSLLFTLTPGLDVTHMYLHLLPGGRLPLPHPTFKSGRVTFQTYYLFCAKKLGLITHTFAVIAECYTRP